METHSHSLFSLVAFLGLAGASIFSLGHCSLSETGGDLKVSAKDGSTYGATSLSIDADGANYASRGTNATIAKIHDTVGLDDLGGKGTQNILVIPVKIDDYQTYATADNRNNIFNTFFGDPGDTGWESVSSFYSKSSYGQLLIKGTVSGWYDCGMTTSQITKKRTNYSGTLSDYYSPTWDILEGAVSWYKKTYNTSCSEFDNDNDGVIDGVWLVYGCPYFSDYNGLSSDDFWAFTYYDYTVSTVSLSSPSGFHYCWASLNFMFDSDGTWGENQLDAHTYIHETGHLLGLDDYYVASDKSTNASPMGAVDMMDANVIDHDAFSKFLFGWVKPYVVSGACSITLKPSATTGQCVLIPTSDGWNGSVFDEYLLLEFYTPTNLNYKDSASAYANSVQGFTENGVRIYHVDARMATYSKSSGKATSYTDSLHDDSSNGTVVAHSNSNSYNYLNPSFRLVQELDCTKKRNFDDFEYVGVKKVRTTADNGSLFQNGDSFSLPLFKNSFPNVTTMNNGTTLARTLSFSSMSDSSIVVTVA
jgi:M6 family metalloprotease-like protein